MCALLPIKARPPRLAEGVLVAEEDWDYHLPASSRLRRGLRSSPQPHVDAPRQRSFRQRALSPAIAYRADLRDTTLPRPARPSQARLSLPAGRCRLACAPVTHGLRWASLAGRGPIDGCAVGWARDRASPSAREPGREPTDLPIPAIALAAYIHPSLSSSGAGALRRATPTNSRQSLLPGTGDEPRAQPRALGSRKEGAPLLPPPFVQAGPAHNPADSSYLPQGCDSVQRGKKNVGTLEKGGEEDAAEPRVERQWLARAGAGQGCRSSGRGGRATPIGKVAGPIFKCLCKARRLCDAVAIATRRQLQ